MEAESRDKTFQELRRKHSIAVFATQNSMRLLLKAVDESLSGDSVAEIAVLRIFYSLKRLQVEKELEVFLGASSTSGTDDNIDLLVPALAEAKEGNYRGVRQCFLIELEAVSSLPDFKNIPDSIRLAEYDSRFASMVPDESKPFVEPPDPWDDQRYIDAYYRSVSPLWTPPRKSLL